jgi:hypothetical protein
VLLAVSAPTVTPDAEGDPGPNSRNSPSRAPIIQEMDPGGSREDARPGVTGLKSARYKTFAFTASVQPT